MRLNLNYLWTAILTGLLTVLSNNLCQCDVNFQPDDNEIADATTDLNNDDIENSLNKRGWSKNFAVWGKRGDWSNFHSWGKREGGIDDISFAQQAPEEKRKWAKFTSWGKRTPGGMSDEIDWRDEIDGDNEEEKRNIETVEAPLFVDRQWPDFGLWGVQPQYDDVLKRKWSNLAVWGKRAADSNLNDLVKRWAKFASWGKRDDDLDSNAIDKRKWAKFASWGKRSDIDNDVTDDVTKRKWSTLSAWGKRAFDEDVDNIDKRKWAKFSSWGKRLRSPQAWLALNNGGKRRWSGLTTWGRR